MKVAVAAAKKISSSSLVMKEIMIFFEENLVLQNAILNRKKQEIFGSTHSHSFIHSLKSLPIQ